MARASSATAQVPLLKSAAGETARCLSVYPTMGQTDGRTQLLQVCCCVLGGRMRAVL